MLLYSNRLNKNISYNVPCSYCFNSVSFASANASKSFGIISGLSGEVARHDFNILFSFKRKSRKHVPCLVNPSKVNKNRISDFVLNTL